MADTRTMAELLQAPTEGYGDAIVIPAILSENFELKRFTQSCNVIEFCRFEKEDHHAHSRWFNKITSTIKYKDVPNSALAYSLTRFPSKLPQIDTFYNSLTSTDQDSLNAAAGGNLLTKIPKDALTLIENKSKVRTSRNRPVVAKVCTNTSTLGLSPDVFAALCTDALVNRSTTRPTGIAEDVFNEIPLILGRPFLRTARALIDVYGEELTLRVSDEAITFKVGNTSRYSYNDVESINRIDVIDIACEEYSQEVLGFSDNSEKEIEAYLASDPVPPGIDDTEFDPEGDIRLIKEMKLNDATRKDHFPLPFMDQMLERLAGNEYYCFLDGFSGYFQILIDPQDQEKTTFDLPLWNICLSTIPFWLTVMLLPLFDSYGDSTSSEYSSDNESILEEDVFSNLPFEFDVEPIPSDVNPIYDEVLEDIDGTDYLIDFIIDFSPKIDLLLEEFASELALINPIPSGIDKVDFDHEGDSRLVKKLSYDNSSPRPPEELNYEDIIEFFSAFPIPVEGSDFLLEETNIILSYLDDSLPELETFSFDIEEKNRGNTTTHFDYSLPIYEKFNFYDDPAEEKNSGSTTIHAEISLPEYESFNDKSDSISVTFDYDSTKEVQIQIPNVSPTHPTFCQGLDFTLFTDFSGSDLVVSFPSGNRNKTFDLGISIEVQSKRFLSLNEFSISFISNPLSLVLETLLPFSPENEDKVFNPGILVSKEEKSPHLIGL
ncbi:hypothetical protein Tco_0250769 [Tanacetum coccineum]